MLSSEQIASVIKEYQRAQGDTGSPEVQIALATAQIRYLQGHFTTHKKDLHSRLGLTKIVSKRRKMLKYLKSTNLSKYRELIEKLEIRG